MNLKKMNLKKILGIVMIIIIAVAFLSIYSLTSKIGDEEFLARINDKDLRVNHIAWIEGHYVPIQVFSIAAVIYTIYTLLNFINSDHIDGKTYKIIIFFVINGIAIIRSLFINQRLFYTWRMAANGEIPQASYLLVPILTTIALYVFGQLIEKSLKDDYYKEAKKNEGTEYKENWDKLEKTLKK